VALVPIGEVIDRALTGIGADDHGGTRRVTVGGDLAEAMAERKHYPVMNGKRVFKHAVTRIAAAIMEGMVTNQLKLEDIDMVIDRRARTGTSRCARAVGVHGSSQR
jgi:3-oxoacyl-[acyl-carrier-protein] synthase III